MYAPLHLIRCHTEALRWDGHQLEYLLSVLFMFHWRQSPRKCNSISIQGKKLWNQCCYQLNLHFNYEKGCLNYGIFGYSLCKTFGSFLKLSISMKIVVSCGTKCLVWCFSTPNCVSVKAQIAVFSNWIFVLKMIWNGGRYFWWSLQHGQLLNE